MNRKELKELFSKFRKDELELILNAIFLGSDIHLKEFSFFLEVYERLDRNDNYDIEVILSNIKEKLHQISDEELEVLINLSNEEDSKTQSKGWYWGEAEEYNEFELDEFELSEFKKDIMSLKISEYLLDEINGRNEKINSKTKRLTM